MITADTLSRMLHALATGYPDRALNLVLTDEALEEDERRPLYQAIQYGKSPHEQARALGDAFLCLKADQAIINECYRVGVLHRRGLGGAVEQSAVRALPGQP